MSDFSMEFEKTDPKKLIAESVVQTCLNDKIQSFNVIAVYEAGERGFLLVRHSGSFFGEKKTHTRITEFFADRDQMIDDLWDGDDCHSQVHDLISRLEENNWKAAGE